MIGDIHAASIDGSWETLWNIVLTPSLAASRDRYGMTPLHKAVLHKRIDNVYYLLKHFPQVINAQDKVR